MTQMKIKQNGNRHDRSKAIRQERMFLPPGISGACKPTMRFSSFLIVCLIAFLAVTLMSCAAKHEIRILYVNDFHGYALPYKPYGKTDLEGGLDYLAFRADALRAEKPTLFLAAGDMIQGNNWANLSQGQSSIEAMNALKVDAMALGNHEFDFGQSVLKKRIAEAAFPVLAANVSGFDSLKPYVLKELDGVSIAVIGVVTADVPYTTNPRNAAGLQFSSPEETVARYVQEVKDKSDVVVVLSHIGFGADKKLAAKVDGIDVIVGGHTHTRVEKPEAVGKTLVVQAFEHAKVLGVLDLTIEKGRVVKAEGRLEPINPAGEKDKTVEAIVDRYQKRVDTIMKEAIGVSQTDLDGENVRIQETNLGDLIADIMRAKSGADAVIINAGAIRTSIGKGFVEVADVYDVVPFDNYIVAIKLTGQQIRDTLEHGVSGIEDKEGRFPQVSGLAFTFDRNAAKGSRVKEVWIGGKPLAAEKEYSVATLDFLAAGGDGYKAFGDAVKSSADYAVVGGAMKGEKLVYSDSSRWLRDVVVDFFKMQKEVSAKTEGRIREIKP